MTIDYSSYKNIIKKYLTTCEEDGWTAQLQIHEENVLPTTARCIPSWVIKRHCLLLPETRIYWPSGKYVTFKGMKCTVLSFPTGFPLIV